MQSKLFKTFQNRGLIRLLSENLPKRNLQNSSELKSSYEEYRKNIRQYNHQALVELINEQEKSLSNIIDCYNSEIKIDLYYYQHDNESIYVESLLNFYGVSYVQERLKDIRANIS